MNIYRVFGKGYNGVRISRQIVAWNMQDARIQSLTFGRDLSIVFEFRLR